MGCKGNRWLENDASYTQVQVDRNNVESSNILPIDIDLKSEWQTTEDVYESKKPAHESGLSSSQVAKLVAAREHVDRISIPSVVCSVIALVQYCKYFKEKSD
ncbi:hypothetical protein GGI11_003150 [Coemansia sp. RSA 2049]|nr:hypothetical protein GGI11_003150 [Coemansia sp. RSA 2049]